MGKKNLGRNQAQCMIMIHAAFQVISQIGIGTFKIFNPVLVEDWIHHAGMDGLLRSCATGCRVDEAFPMDDLVDSISADTSGLRCGRVKAQVLDLTWIRPGSG